MQSSGTTGNNLSKIYLDESNAKNQIKALSQLFFDITQNKDRVPMLVIDSKSILKDRKNFSARSAAVLGFSLFAKNITYALKENMKLLVDQNAKFQHMIGRMLEAEIMRDLGEFADFLKENADVLRGEEKEV